MQKHLRLTITLLCLLGILGLTSPGLAKSIFEQATDGLTKMSEAAYGATYAYHNEPLLTRIIRVTNFLIGLVGILFFILLLYAGFLWGMARGNDEQINRAKKIIREVTVGIIIILTARIITEIILFAFESAAQ